MLSSIPKRQTSFVVPNKPATVVDSCLAHGEYVEQLSRRVQENLLKRVISVSTSNC